MKKKILILISAGAALIAAAVLATLFLTGRISWNSNIDDSTKSVLNAIKTTYSDDDLPIYCLPMEGSGVYFRGGAYSPLLEDFLWSLSVEISGPNREYDYDEESKYWEKYFVLRANNEKVGNYYLYIFFRSSDNAPSMTWLRVGRAVRVAKRLTAKDFENITIGSTIADVTAIDPVTQVMIPEDFIRYDGTVVYHNVFETFHYTVDGLYYITFERESPEDEYLITNVEFDPSFSVPVYDRGIVWDNTYENGNDPNNPDPPVHQEIELRHLPD